MNSTKKKSTRTLKGKNPLQLRRPLPLSSSRPLPLPSFRPLPLPSFRPLPLRSSRPPQLLSSRPPQLLSSRPLPLPSYRPLPLPSRYLAPSSLELPLLPSVSEVLYDYKNKENKYMIDSHGTLFFSEDPPNHKQYYTITIPKNVEIYTYAELGNSLDCTQKSFDQICGFTQKNNTFFDLQKANNPLYKYTYEEGKENKFPNLFFTRDDDRTWNSGITYCPDVMQDHMRKRVIYNIDNLPEYDCVVESIISKKYISKKYDDEKNYTDFYNTKLSKNKQLCGSIFLIDAIELIKSHLQTTNNTNETIKLYIKSCLNEKNITEFVKEKSIYLDAAKEYYSLVSEYKNTANFYETETMADLMNQFIKHEHDSAQNKINTIDKTILNNKTNLDNHVTSLDFIKPTISFNYSQNYFFYNIIVVGKNFYIISSIDLEDEGWSNQIGPLILTSIILNNIQLADVPNVTINITKDNITDLTRSLKEQILEQLTKWTKWKVQQTQNKKAGRRYYKKTHKLKNKNKNKK